MIKGLDRWLTQTPEEYWGYDEDGYERYADKLIEAFGDDDWQDVEDAEYQEWKKKFDEWHEGGRKAGEYPPRGRDIHAWCDVLCDRGWSPEQGARILRRLYGLKSIA